MNGATGAAGPTGATGETWTTGLAGLAGVAGPTGATGAIGLTGLPGLAGATGPKGEAGTAGPAGANGPTGATGSTGAAGPAGSSGSTAYAEFYALMPPDNTATVAAEAPVQFPQNGPTTGTISRLNSAEFVLPSIGTYSLSFSVSVTEPGQLVIALDSGGGMVELPYTVYGRATGTSQVAGDALVTTTAADSTVELRNPAGNTPALTITPLAGGTHAAAAAIVIQQLS